MKPFLFFGIPFRSLAGIAIITLFIIAIPMIDSSVSDDFYLYGMFGTTMIFSFVGTVFFDPTKKEIVFTRHVGLCLFWTVVILTAATIAISPDPEIGSLRGRTGFLITTAITGIFAGILFRGVWEGIRLTARLFGIFDDN